MGADAYSYLYICVDFDDVYEAKRDEVEYDLHDPRTGQKTGQKGKDVKHYWLNKRTGDKYYCDRYELPTQKFTHLLEQETDDYIIGIQLSKMRDGGGGEFITEERIQGARDEFERSIRPFVGDTKPVLCHNLYWSY